MNILEEERNTILLLLPQEPVKPPKELVAYIHTARTLEEWLALGLASFEETMTLPEDDDGEPYPSWEVSEIDIDGYYAEFTLAEVQEQWDWGDAFDGPKDTRYLESPAFALALIDAGVGPNTFRGVDAILQKYLDAEVALSSGEEGEFCRLVDDYLSESAGSSLECVINRKAQVLGISESDILLEEVTQCSEIMDYAVNGNRPVQWVEKARDANSYSLLLNIVIEVVDKTNEILQTDWTNKQLPKALGDLERDADWHRRVKSMLDYFLTRIGSMRRVICDELFIQNIESPEDLRQMLFLVVEKNPKKKGRIEKLMKKYMNKDNLDLT